MFAGLCVLFCIGCVSLKTSGESPADAAKRYSIEKFRFSHPKVERVESTQDGYVVLVWDVPYAPGGNVILTMSKDLRLVSWNGLR